MCQWLVQEEENGNKEKRVQHQRLHNASRWGGEAASGPKLLYHSRQNSDVTPPEDRGRLARTTSGA